MVLSEIRAEIRKAKDKIASLPEQSGPEYDSLRQEIYDLEVFEYRCEEYYAGMY